MSQTVIYVIVSMTIILAGTTLGSAFVFFFRKSLGPKMKSSILGFAGGIMIAAALFGLINPSIQQARDLDVYNNWEFVPPLVGFMLGGALLYLLDKITPHMHTLTKVNEGPANPRMSENLKFFMAVTIHNIPEGLSVGFACGLALSLEGDAALSASLSALSLAIGIAIQNIPEGMAVSVPMFSDGMSKGKAFLMGVLTGVVEPLFAVVALFLGQLSVANPWFLAFAGGAMVYVTLDEILPEARESGLTHWAMWSFMIGFALMMVLEVTLG